MAIPKSNLENRREQMFPLMDDRDIARLRRFGEVRHFAPGDYVMKGGRRRLAQPLSLMVSST